jgi:hypothetical protein
MRWVRHLVIWLAIALAITNAQCVARCAAIPCHAEDGSQSHGASNLPPCHQHPAPKQPDAPKPCTLSLLPIGDGASVANAFDQEYSTTLKATSTVAFAGLLRWRLIEITQVASTPYAADSPSHSVLRI